MLVRQESVMWVIKGDSLYKQTELVCMPMVKRHASSWKSEYIRKATEQDKLGNV